MENLEFNELPLFEKKKIAERNDQVKHYKPGITLANADRKKMSEKYAKSDEIRILLLGPVGVGKSAFLDSCDHRFNGLRFEFFVRSALPGRNTTTQPAPGRSIVSDSSVRVGDAITIWDSMGIKTISTVASINKAYEEIHEQTDTKAFYQKAWDFFTGYDIKLEFHAVVLVWSGANQLSQIADLKDMLIKLNEVGGTPPIVLVTHDDEIDQDKRTRIIQHFRDSCNQTNVLFIANYSQASPTGEQVTPKIAELYAATDKTIDKVIGLSLLAADKIEIKRIQSKSGKCTIL